MRVRRRVSESVSLLVVPAICIAFTAYFGYSGIVGPRGLLAWSAAQGQLAMTRQELSGLRAERIALERRIRLLDEHALDPDLLEEVTRGVLSQGRAGEVAIPRNKQ